MDIIIELAWELLKGLLIYFTTKAIEDCLGDLFKYLEDYSAPRLSPSI